MRKYILAQLDMVIDTTQKLYKPKKGQQKTRCEEGSKACGERKMRYEAISTNAKCWSLGGEKNPDI